MGNAVAIENGQVHHTSASWKKMGDDRGQQLSVVNVRKAILAGKSRGDLMS
jgi:hypothetical protein